MKKKSALYLTLVLALALFFEARGISAENFQNNLLKADIHKNSLGGIKVVLYTSKPYSDAVTVNKKGDCEYVILMPETSNSMTSKPSLKLADDSVKGFEVKTQQYSTSAKGYTKIVITTTRPIEIVPAVQTLPKSDYKLAETDYRQLLAQADSVKKNIAKTPETQNQKVIQNSQKQKLTQNLNEKPKEINANVKKESQKPTDIKKVIKIDKPANKLDENVQDTKLSSESENKSNLTEPKTEIIKKVEPEVFPKNDEVNSTEMPSSAVIVETAPKQDKFVAKTKRLLNSYISPETRSFLSRYLTLLVASSVSLLVLLLLVARKINRNNQKQKEAFMQHLKETPTQDITGDLENKIDENMSWQEKFQTYVEATQPQVQKEDEIKDDAIIQNADLDNLFSGHIAQDIANQDDSHLYSSEELFSSVEEDSASNEFEENLVSEEALELSEPEQTDLAENKGIGDEFSDELNPLEDVSSYDEMELYDEGLELNEPQEVSLEELFGADDEIEDEETQENYNDFFASPEGEADGLSAESFNNIGYLNDLEDLASGLEDKTDEDDVVVSSFEIDSKKGFYLVKDDSSVSLVGMIDEEVFVLKKFPTAIHAKISARLNDEDLNKSTYIVKVDRFRALVEVSQNSMNLLMEL